jgi:GTP1/Obg family GTP-binding protein
MKFREMNLKLLRTLVIIISVIGLIPLAVLNAQDVVLQSTPGELVRNNLEAFAKAYTEVGQIHSSYEERIIQSADERKAEALQQEANQKMTQAVADHGLTIEDYNTIFKAIQTDPALKEEFMTVLHQTR